MNKHVTCDYCRDEPEPGRIETPNNGPIVPCPMCNTSEYGFTGRNRIEGVAPMNAFVNPEHVARLEAWRTMRTEAEELTAHSYRCRARHHLRAGRVGYARDNMRNARHHFRMVEYFRRPE